MTGTESPYDHERLYVAFLPEMFEKIMARGFNGWRAGGLFFVPIAFVDPDEALANMELPGGTVAEIDMSMCSEKAFLRPSYVGPTDFPTPPRAWTMFGKIPREAFSRHDPSLEQTTSPKM